MKTSEELKNVVKEKYGELAKASNKSGCCGISSNAEISTTNKSGCCGSSSNAEFIMIGDEYKSLKGYVADADLALGCGIPTEFAEIKPGDTVLDLGSGAGNDVFVARSIVGETGRVIGLDMTEEMIEKANRNNVKVGFKNVEFRLGDIEDMPIDDNIADVVVSNCVLNLVPDKQKAFSEMYRVIKPGGHFCVSDIVVQGDIPDSLRESAAMYIGCVSGALKQEEYLTYIREAGFTNIKIHKSVKVDLPEQLLKKYLTDGAIEEYREHLKGIFSITVTGYKR